MTYVSKVSEYAKTISPVLRKGGLALSKKYNFPGLTAEEIEPESQLTDIFYVFPPNKTIWYATAHTALNKYIPEADRKTPAAIIANKP